MIFCARHRQQDKGKYGFGNEVVFLCHLNFGNEEDPYGKADSNGDDKGR